MMLLKSWFTWVKFAIRKPMAFIQPRKDGGIQQLAGLAVFSPTLGVWVPVYGAAARQPPDDFDRRAIACYWRVIHRDQVESVLRKS